MPSARAPRPDALQVDAEMLTGAGLQRHNSGPINPRRTSPTPVPKTDRVERVGCGPGTRSTFGDLRRTGTLSARVQESPEDKEVHRRAFQQMAEAHQQESERRSLSPTREPKPLAGYGTVRNRSPEMKADKSLYSSRPSRNNSPIRSVASSGLGSNWSLPGSLSVAAGGSIKVAPGTQPSASSGSYGEHPVSSPSLKRPLGDVTIHSLPGSCTAPTCGSPRNPFAPQIPSVGQHRTGSPSRTNSPPAGHHRLSQLHSSRISETCRISETVGWRASPTQQASADSLPVLVPLVAAAGNFPCVPEMPTALDTAPERRPPSPQHLDRVPARVDPLDQFPSLPSTQETLPEELLLAPSRSSPLRQPKPDAGAAIEKPSKLLPPSNLGAANLASFNQATLSEHFFPSDQHSTSTASGHSANNRKRSTSKEVKFEAALPQEQQQQEVPRPGDDAAGVIRRLSGNRSAPDAALPSVSTAAPGPSYSLPGDLTLGNMSMETDPEGVRSPDEKSADLAAGVPADQYIDVRISKLRDVVDWRINDLSRVLQHAEELWGQQLEAERQNRQDAVVSVQRLTETQKLIVDANLATESSRVDEAVRNITNCQLELKVLSEVMAEVGDDVKAMREAQSTYMAEVMGAKQSADQESLSREEIAVALKCDIDLFKATLSQTVAKERSRIDTLHQRLDASQNFPAPLGEDSTIERSDLLRSDMDYLDAAMKEHADRLQSMNQEVVSLSQQQETLFRGSLQDQQRVEVFEQYFKDVVARFEADGCEHGVVLERVQADVRQLEANVAEARANMKRESDRLEAVNQKVDALPCDGTHSASSSPTRPIQSAYRVSTGNSKSNHVYDLADKIEAEQLERKTAVASMTRDIEQWESLLAGFVSQSRERTDMLSQKFEELRCEQRSVLPRSPPSPQFGELAPSPSRLDASIEHRISDIIGRLHAEESDRKEAIRGIQRNISDLQTTHLYTERELGTISEDSGKHMENELHEVKNSVASLELEVRKQEYAVQSAVDQVKGRMDCITGDVEETIQGLRKLQDTGSPVMSLKSMFEERLKQVDDRLEVEQCQRRESQESMLRDVTNLPSVIWDSISSDRERLDLVGKTLDAVSQKFNSFEAELVDSITEVAVRLDQECQERNACDDALQRDMGNFQSWVNDKLAQDREVEHPLKLEDDAAFMAMRHAVDAIVDTQRDVSRLPTILGQAGLQQEERLDGMAQQLEALKLQQQSLLEPALAAAPQARAIETKLTEHIENAAEHLGVLLETAISKAETSMGESLSKERVRIDSILPELPALKAQVQSLASHAEAAFSDPAKANKERVALSAAVEAIASQQKSIGTSLDQRLKEVATHSAGFQDRWAKSLDAERHERKTAIHSLYNDIIQLEAMFVDNGSKERRQSHIFRGEMKERLDPPGSACEQFNIGTARGDVLRHDTSRRPPGASPNLSPQRGPLLSTNSAPESSATQDFGGLQDIQEAELQSVPTVRPMRQQHRVADHSLRSGNRNPVTILSLIDSVARDRDVIDAQCRQLEVTVSEERQKIREDR